MVPKQEEHYRCQRCCVLTRSSKARKQDYEPLTRTTRDLDTRRG